MRVAIQRKHTLSPAFTVISGCRRRTIKPLCILSRGAPPALCRALNASPDVSPASPTAANRPWPRTPQVIEKYVCRSPVRVMMMSFVHDSYRTDRFGRRSQTEQNLPLVGGHQEINVIRPMTYRLMTYSVGAPQNPQYHHLQCY